MVQYMHKQCASSGWLNQHSAPDPSVIGIMMKLGNDELARQPASLNSMVIAAFESLDAAIAFTMSSDITASLFRQLSPYQTEIVIQPHGIKIPIVDSLQQVVDLANTRHMRGNACIVKDEKIVLVWTNSIDNLLPHGAELEKLLVETVYFPRSGLTGDVQRLMQYRCGVHTYQAPDLALALSLQNLSTRHPSEILPRQMQAATITRRYTPPS